MMYLKFLLIGILFGFIYIVIKKSIYSPKAGTAQAIMMFGKLYTIISNIDGKTIYDGEDDPNGPREKWDLIDRNNRNKYNIYFYLWPFFTVYKFPISYPLAIKLGEERPGDKIIWQKEGTNEVVVSRTNYSDHLYYRVEYPTVTQRLNTKELASIDTFSNNILELVNPARALFDIKDWMGASMEILHGGLRTIVAERSIMNLNILSSLNTDSTFDESMKEIVNDNPALDNHPSLKSLGFKLFKAILKDFDASDENSKKLLNSYTDVKVAEENSKAKVNLAKGNAKALAIEQKAIIAWRKKYLVDTGLAKIDDDGNITKLVPDANVKVGADALAKLKNLTGTLVINSEGLTKIVNLNEPTKPKV